MEERKEFLEQFYGSGPKYKTFVDFRKKRGPLADMHVTFIREMVKIENGGQGSGNETVITPKTGKAAPTGPEKAPAAKGTTESAASPTPTQVPTTTPEDKNKETPPAVQPPVTPVQPERETTPATGDSAPSGSATPPGDESKLDVNTAGDH
jgi:hypothetical protein